MGLQPTASKSELLLRCQYPFAPNLDVPHSGDGSEAARYGSAFHEIMAHMLVNRPSEGSPSSPNPIIVTAAARRYDVLSAANELEGHVTAAYGVLMKWLEGDNYWDINFAAYPQQRVETTMALDVFSGEVRDIPGPDLEMHKYHDLWPHEIAGTLDYAAIGGIPPHTLNGVEHLGTPTLLLDHKTGGGDYSSPIENAQLKTLACMVKADIVAVLHADRRGLPMVYADSITAEDRTSHLIDLRQAFSRIGDGSMRPGSWCRYCPAKPVCPAADGEMLIKTTTLVKSMGGLVRDKVGAITTDRVGELHQLLGEFEKLKTRAMPEIKKMVLDNPGEVYTRPDGKVLSVKEVTKERLSKSGIIRALGKVAGEALIAELREKGAVYEETELHLKAEIDG